MTLETRHRSLMTRKSVSWLKFLHVLVQMNTALLVIHPSPLRSTSPTKWSVELFSPDAL